MGRTFILSCATCGEVHGWYDRRLVALSVVVAIAASYTALDLGGRVATNVGLARRAWLLTGAVMMGLGVWSMHFVGMQAFVMPMRVIYEPGRTVLSMLVAMAASGLALFLVSRPILAVRSLVLGALVMGLGIASMHYIGMAAMQMDASIIYDLRLVSLSGVIAVLASLAALALAFVLRGEEQPRFAARAIAAVLMGIAIAGMHYTGMASATFLPSSQVRIDELRGFEVGQLGAAAIGGGTLVGLGLMLLTSLVDLERRRAQRTLRFLAESSVQLGRLVEPSVLLARAAELVVTELCDLCVIDMFVEDRLVRSAATERGRAEVMAFDVPAGSVSRERSTECVLNVTADTLAHHEESEVFRRFVGREHICSYLRVPIIDQRQAIGVMTFLTRHPRKFSEPDVEVAQEYARRVTVALEAAELYRQAEQAIQLRDEFLSVASHELRTPMTALRLQLDRFARMVDKGVVETDPKVQKAIDSSRASSDRLTRLIDELLDVSRISAGQLPIQPEPFDLGEVAKEVVEQHREELDTAKTPVELDVQPTEGTWDRLRMEQVLTNLLTNAVKYGGSHPVSVRVRSERDEAVIEVEDRGIGISPEKQATVFNRFERAVSSAHYPGLGLGLYITRQIVDAHGGSIELKSEVGVGSTFTVHLPRSSPQTLH